AQLRKWRMARDFGRRMHSKQVSLVSASQENIVPTIEWIAVDALKPNARNARTLAGTASSYRRSCPSSPSSWWPRAWKSRSPALRRSRSISSPRTSRRIPPIRLTPVDPRWATAAPVTRPGDLWQLGHHRLLSGDARGADDLARLMGGAQAAMAF